MENYFKTANSGFGSNLHFRLKKVLKDNPNLGYIFIGIFIML